MEVSSESLNLQLTQGCIEDMRSSKKIRKKDVLLLL